jgi:hypothetical protein
MRGQLYPRKTHSSDLSENHLLSDEQQRQREEMRQRVSKVRTEIDALRREQQLARGCRCEIF